jgi:hypothetical protein
VWRSNQIKNSLLNLVFVIYVRDESNITKTVISMNLDGHPRRGLEVDLRKDGWTV